MVEGVEGVPARGILQSVFRRTCKSPLHVQPPGTAAHEIVILLTYNLSVLFDSVTIVQVIWIYSGTPPNRTPSGPGKLSGLERFRGFFQKFISKSIIIVYIHIHFIYLGISMPYIIKINEANMYCIRNHTKRKARYEMNNE